MPAGLLSRLGFRCEDAKIKGPSWRRVRGKTDKGLRENVIRQAKVMKREKKNQWGTSRQPLVAKQIIPKRSSD